MSALYNQTNIAPGTSQFLTRAEVDQALSTIAGDLSGADLSTLFYNPNPKFSSISMPASGTISLPGVVQAKALNLSTGTSIVEQTFTNTPGPLQMAFSKAGVTTDVYAKNFIGANTSAAIATSTNNLLLYSYLGIQGVPNTGSVQPFLTWYPSNPAGSNWALTNVSSINGQQANTSPTTFTTLTGGTLVANTVNASQVIGVSSLNGLTYQAALNASFSGSSNIAVPNNTATKVYQVTLNPNTLLPNQNYIYDLPIVLGNFAPSPLNFLLILGVRLGANGNINYSLPYYVASNSPQTISLNLTGVGNTNPTSVSAQTIEVWAVQTSGSTFNCPIAAPPSGAGNNNWTLKILS